MRRTGGDRRAEKRVEGVLGQNDGEERNKEGREVTQKALGTNLRGMRFNLDKTLGVSFLIIKIKKLKI